MRCQRLGPGCWHVEGLDFGMSNSYFKHLKTNMALLKKIRLEKHVDTFDLNILDPFMAKLAQDVRVLTQRP